MVDHQRNPEQAEALDGVQTDLILDRNHRIKQTEHLEAQTGQYRAGATLLTARGRFWHSCGTAMKVAALCALALTILVVAKGL